MNEKEKRDNLDHAKSDVNEKTITKKSQLKEDIKTFVIEDGTKDSKSSNPIFKFFGGIGTWFNNLKPWVRALILISLPIMFILIGVLVVLRGLLWYNPVSPVTKLFESRQAHLFFQGTRLYSYSHEVDYDMDVIYDNGEDIQFSDLGTSSKKAVKLDIPLDIEKIEIKVQESKIVEGTEEIKNFDKVYKRKVDNPNIFVASSGAITIKNKSKGTNLLDLTNAIDINKKDLASDETKFVSAIFLKKTPLEIVNNLGKNVSNAKIVVDENSYDDYDQYVKEHSKDSDIHQIFWHATVETNFRGQESSIRNIEPYVLNRVVEFTYEYLGKFYTIFLIKSENGNDPTLGVKYGLLLSTNGYSFAGKDIDGKDWILENNMSVSPANDTLGIYTILVRDDSSDAKSLANQIASEVGGLN